MAIKRTLRTKNGTEEKIEEEPLRPELTWKEWFLEKQLKYWYFFLCVLVDVLIPLEVLRLDVSFSSSLAIAALVGLVVVEAIFYRYLWGSKGIWTFTPAKESDLEDELW